MLITLININEPHTYSCLNSNNPMTNFFKTIQNAHRGWVSSLALSECYLQINSSSQSPSPPSLPSSGWLLSGCQSGTLRLWSSSNLTLLSEYRAAHQGAINCLVVGGSSEGLLGLQKTSQQQFVFTASKSVIMMVMMVMVMVMMMVVAVILMMMMIVIRI